MATKAAKALADGIQAAIDDAADKDKETSSDDETLDSDVLRALTELQGADDIRWQIHRVNEPNAGYCGEVSTLELTLDGITRMCGPGKYRVKGIKPNGQYFKSAILKIATPLQATPTNDAAALEKLLEKTRGGDMMPLLLGMMNSNTSIVTAALNGNRRTESVFPWQALLVAAPALLPAMREFFVRPDPDDKSLEKVLKLLTVLEKVRGDDGKSGGSNWTDVIRDALSTLPAMVGRAPAPAANTVSVAPVAGTRGALPAPTATNGDAVDGDTPAIPDTPEAVEATPENGAMFWLKNKLTEAVEWARLNRDPSLRAEILIEEFPPILPIPMLLGMLKRDDWFEQLCTFQPACTPYRGWFEELRNELIQQLESPDNERDRTDDGGNGEGSGTG